MAPDHSGGSGLPMRPASDIPRTNAGSFEHSELIRVIADADGAQVQELGQLWDDMGREITEFGASLQRTAITSESIWIGQAAKDARDKINNLVDWCAQTGRGLQHMGATVVRTQGEAAQTAQVSMPPEVPYDPAVYQNRINSTSNPIEWIQILGDAREQAARHDAAHAEAVRVIEAYSTSLLSTNGAMPAFTPPPEFGIQDKPKHDPPGPPSPPPRDDERGGGGGGAGDGSISKGGLQIPGNPGDGDLAGTRPGTGDGDLAGTRPGPNSDRHRPEVQPPASTPSQIASPVSSSPGHGLPAGGGTGGTGVPGFMRAAGIGGLGGSGTGVSAGAVKPFGPRGSGVANTLGRAGLASAGGAEGTTGAGRAAAGMAGRGPGGGLGAGGFAPMVGGGRGQGGENTEHQRPSYLIETEDIWGDGHRVAPAVIGEDPPESDRRDAR